MADVAGQIERLLDPILRSMGLSLWDMEFKKEGPHWLLRIYIDRDQGGVSLDDCEAVSRDLGTTLDVEDIIPHAYTLEVSSPGLDRSLTKPEHFVKCSGSMVKIRTFQAVEGQKAFRGKLLGIRDDIVTVELEGGKNLDIELSVIAKASLEVEW